MSAAYDATIHFMERNRERYKMAQDLFKLFWDIRLKRQSCEIIVNNKSMKKLSDDELNTIIAAMVDHQSALNKEYQVYEGLKKELEENL